MKQQQNNASIGEEHVPRKHTLQKYQGRELYADHLISLMYHSPNKTPDLKICFGLHIPNWSKYF